VLALAVPLAAAGAAALGLLPDHLWRFGLLGFLGVFGTSWITYRWAHPAAAVDPATGGSGASAPAASPTAVSALAAVVDTEPFLDAIGVPLLVYSVDGRCLFANAVVRQVLGITSSGPLPDSVWDGIRVLEVDGETPVTEERLPLRRAAAGHRVDTELVLSADGEPPHRFMVQGRPVTNDDGAVQAVVITALDVTDVHHQHQLATWQTAQLAAVGAASRAVLREQDARAAMCRAAVTVSGAGMATLHEPDAAGNLVATACYGGDLVGETVSLHTAAMLTESFASARTLTISDVADDPRVNAALLETWRAQQDQPLVGAVWVPIVNRGRCLGVLSAGFFEAVPDWTTRVEALEILAGETAVAIERQNLLRRLSDEAWSDGLTGAANRRAWDATLAERIDLARRTARPLSVVLVDLDHFKRFNDERGHLAGDDLLRAAVRAWQQRLRPGDLLCRWGGEEFAVLLPACTLAGAERLAADLRALVPEGQTISAGVATWNGDETTDNLIARADAALYAAKHAGRDRVVADATQ
jgi:diguanylate cyclase (GGDEF)-like protein